MARKLTDDDIRAQIEKNKTEHGYLQKAVGQLGDELGVQLDEKGDVVGHTQKTHSVAPSVPSTSPVLFVDKEDLKWAVEEALKANPLKVIVQQPQGSTNQLSPASVSSQVIDKIDKGLKPVIDKYSDQIVEAFGTATKLNAEKPVFEEKTVRQIKKLHAYVGKCLRWFKQDFLSKTRKAVVYEIAICCALFGAYQYYHNQQLLTQSKKMLLYATFSAVTLPTRR